MRAKIFRNVFPVLLFVVLPVASWGLEGNITADTYSSPAGNLSVMVPPLTEVGVSDDITDNEISEVDFTAKQSYWKVDGSYSVLWTKIKPDQKEDPTPKDFTYLKKLAKAGIEAKGGTLNNISCKIITLKTATKASQCVAHITLDDTPAYFVQTGLIAGDFIVYAVGLEPAVLIAPREFNWPRYTSFVESIKAS